MVPKSSTLYTDSPHLSPVSTQLKRVLRELVSDPDGPLRKDTNSSGRAPPSDNTVSFFEFATIILLENRTADSHWRAYFDLLSFPQSPLFYTAEALAEFQTSFITSARLKYLETFLFLFRKFMRYPAYANLVGGSSISDAATDAVVSAAGRHDESMSAAAATTRSASTTQAAGAQSSKPFMFSFTPVELDFLWAASILLQRSYAWNEVVIIPFMDLLNYDSEAHLHMLHVPHIAPHRRIMYGDKLPPLQEPGLGAMGLALNRNVTAGQELHFSYGINISSARLLLQYGFVLRSSVDSGNPADQVHLYIDFDMGTRML